MNLDALYKVIDDNFATLKAIPLLASAQLGEDEGVKRLHEVIAKSLIDYRDKEQPLEPFILALLIEQHTALAHGLPSNKAVLATKPKKPKLMLRDRFIFNEVTKTLAFFDKWHHYHAAAESEGWLGEFYAWYGEKPPKKKTAEDAYQEVAERFFSKKQGLDYPLSKKSIKAIYLKVRNQTADKKSDLSHFLIWPN